MNEYIGNNIIEEPMVENISTINNNWEVGQNLMIIVVGIIYLIGVCIWLIKDKKERKLLFAINVGCDLAFIFKTTVRAFNVSYSNGAEQADLFIIIQWIFSIIIYKFVYKFIKEENRKLIIILTTIYLIISIIFMCIIFPNIYIPRGIVEVQ